MTPLYIAVGIGASGNPSSRWFLLYPVIGFFSYLLIIKCSQSYGFLSYFFDRTARFLSIKKTTFIFVFSGLISAVIFFVVYHHVLPPLQRPSDPPPSNPSDKKPE